MLEQPDRLYTHEKDKLRKYFSELPSKRTLSASKGLSLYDLNLYKSKAGLENPCSEAKLEKIAIFLIAEGLVSPWLCGDDASRCCGSTLLRGNHSRLSFPLPEFRETSYENKNFMFFFTKDSDPRSAPFIELMHKKPFGFDIHRPFPVNDTGFTFNMFYRVTDDTDRCSAGVDDFLSRDGSGYREPGEVFDVSYEDIGSDVFGNKLPFLARDLHEWYEMDEYEAEEEGWDAWGTPIPLPRVPNSIDWAILSEYECQISGYHEMLVAKGFKPVLDTPVHNLQYRVDSETHWLMPYVRITPK